MKREKEKRILKKINNDWHEKLSHNDTEKKSSAELLKKQTNKQYYTAYHTNTSMEDQQAKNKLHGLQQKETSEMKSPASPAKTVRLVS